MLASERDEVVARRSEASVPGRIELGAQDDEFVAQGVPAPDGGELGAGLEEGP